MSMDNPFDFYNTLSYDEQVLSDKLGMAFNDPSPVPGPALNMEMRVRDRMRESNMIRDQVRREMRRLSNEQGNKTRETFVLKQEKDDPSVENMCSGSKCGCASCKRKRLHFMPEEEPILDHKTTVVLLFILFVFCIIQYMNIQQLNHKVEKLHIGMCQLMYSVHTPPVKPKTDE